jgi:hypothetical protein
MNKPLRRCSRVAPAVALAVVLVGCGSAPRTLATTPSSPEVQNPHVEVVASLPGHNLTPSGAMAGSQTAAGVWLWTSTEEGASVTHLNDGSSDFDTTIPLGTSPTDIVPEEGAPISVRTGSVMWVAQNLTLKRLDLTDNTVKTFPIPAEGENVTMDSYRPSLLRNRHAAVSVAQSADGTAVAIAVSYTSTIELFTPKSAEFETVRLPEASDAKGVAFLPDGRVVVGIADYSSHLADTVLIWDSMLQRFTSSIPVPDSSAVVSGADGTIVVGVAEPVIVTANSVSDIGAGDESVERAGPATVLPNGHRAIATQQALMIWDANNALVQSLEYPRQQCRTMERDHPLGETSTSEASPTTTGPCYIEPVALAGDSVGNLWVELQGYSGPELAVVRGA